MESSRCVVRQALKMTEPYKAEDKSRGTKRSVQQKHSPADFAGICGCDIGLRRSIFYRAPCGLMSLGTLNHFH